MGTDRHRENGERVVTLDDPTRLGFAVVEALADVLDVPVEDIELELNDYVDVDALDRLFARRLDGTPRPGGTIRFTVRDFDVIVDTPETVTVRRHE